MSFCKSLMIIILPGVGFVEFEVLITVAAFLHTAQGVMLLTLRGFAAISLAEYL